MTLKNVIFLIFCYGWMPVHAIAGNQTDIRDYQSFWLWGGVQPPSVISHAKILYLLQGTVSEAGKQLHFEKHGPSAGHLPVSSIFLVYRLETVIWNEALMRTWLLHIHAWESKGSKVTGIQLDFDAASHHLDNYAEFLKSVRRALPPHYKLSVTGLLDWANNAPPSSLQALTNVADEIVFQTYQGKHTIPQYQAYLERIADFKQSFKVGLVEDGLWEPSIKVLMKLKSNSQFKGYVVFLLPRDQKVTSSRWLY